MLTVLKILVISAFIIAIISSTGKYPVLWVSVVLLCIAGLLKLFPLG